MDSPLLTSNFPSSQVRQQVLATMQMGIPNDPDDRAVFYFKEDKEYTQKTSPSGIPYDKKASAVIDNTKAPVSDVMYAVEYVERNPDYRATGDYDNVRAVITMVDTEFEKVRGAVKVKLGGDSYEIGWVKPLGLFDITVYQISCITPDASMKKSVSS